MRTVKFEVLLYYSLPMREIFSLGSFFVFAILTLGGESTPRLLAVRLFPKVRRKMLHYSFVKFNIHQVRKDYVWKKRKNAFYLRRGWH